MKAILATISMLLVGASALDAAVQKSFGDFAVKYNKKYVSDEERAYRLGVFHMNMQKAQSMMVEGNDASFGVTKFMDLTPEEFKVHLGYKKNKNLRGLKTQIFVEDDAPYPTSYDWRSKGAVTPVKNQAQCGSCWAFSATEEIESMWFLAGNPLVELAPQQIVSCDKKDLGCNGGDTTTAYQYVQQAGGIESSSAYPYTSGNGVTGQCKFDASKIVAHISGFTYATQTKNETQMAVAAANVGPISICADASTWQFYTGGIIQKGCAQQLDHCIQIVGYNAEGATPYWLIRNSWGTDWGNQGYIYVEMFKNLCGVANEATIVTI